MISKRYITMQSLAFSIHFFLKQDCCNICLSKRKGFVKKVGRKKNDRSMFFCFGNQLGIFFVIWFIISFAWFFLHPVQPTLYAWLLQLNFFFFSRMDFLGFISGAIQSYIWGYIAVATWMLAAKISGWRK